MMKSTPTSRWYEICASRMSASSRTTRVITTSAPLARRRVLLTSVAPRGETAGSRSSLCRRRSTRRWTRTSSPSPSAVLRLPSQRRWRARAEGMSKPCRECDSGREARREDAYRAAASPRRNSRPAATRRSTSERRRRTGAPRGQLPTPGSDLPLVGREPSRSAPGTCVRNEQSCGWGSGRPSTGDHPGSVRSSVDLTDVFPVPTVTSSAARWSRADIYAERTGRVTDRRRRRKPNGHLLGEVTIDQRRQEGPYE